MYIEFRKRIEEALIESRSIITRFDWKNHYDKTMQIFKAFMNDMQQIGIKDHRIVETYGLESFHRRNQFDFAFLKQPLLLKKET